MELAALCAFAFLAGFVDSIVGGGGLVQLPALFVVRPDLPVAAVLATNKLASVAGTAVAASQYLARVRIDPGAVVPAALCAFFSSFAGACAVSSVEPSVLRPMILALLVAVAAYTVARKDFGAVHAPRLSKNLRIWAGMATGTAIGFYDGFFGPGTGSFLIFVFIGIFGFDFLISSASSKVVNLSTNLAALIYFGAAGHVEYRLALPMAVFNVCGSLLGARLAILKGSAFVRALFITIVSLMIARFGYDVFFQPAEKYSPQRPSTSALVSSSHSSSSG